MMGNSIQKLRKIYQENNIAEIFPTYWYVDLMETLRIQNFILSFCKFSVNQSNGEKNETT